MFNIRAIWARVVLAFSLFMMISVPAAATPAPESGSTINSPTSDNVVAPEHQSVNSANREVAKVGNTLWVGNLADSSINVAAEVMCAATMMSNNPTTNMVNNSNPVLLNNALTANLDERNACATSVKSEYPDNSPKFASLPAAPMDPGRDIEYRTEEKKDQAWT